LGWPFVFECQLALPKHIVVVNNRREVELQLDRLAPRNEHSLHLAGRFFDKFGGVRFASHK
jgi:hypothetical protein